jgi:chromosome segregation protein
LFLKSVEIFGFKSFADRTRIVFNEGISAILGPNGCGKSNIVDSIKWVMGEQSSRSLRAEHMQDVIFNGTEARKPLSVAEVTLLLGNDGGQLAFDAPEIAIRRRLYRNGESEYSLNGQPVRLREIRELFYDTGIGKSAYSVMEQGNIDQVLSSKPEERRLIFEEAAGITRYRVRGLEAERKLERTEENMRQVEGVLQEVKRSHDTLKVQAQKTTEYRTYREQIFDAELDVQLLRLRDLLDRKVRREQHLATRSGERQRVQQRIDAINASMETGMDRVNTLETSLVDTQKRVYSTDLEKNNKSSQIRILTERRHEMERKIQDDEQRQKVLSDKVQALLAEIEEQNRQREAVQKQMDEIAANAAAFERDIQAFIERARANDEQIGRNERRVAELEKLVEELRVELRKITDDIVTQLDQRLKEMGYSHTRRHETEQRIETILRSLEIQFEGRAGLLGDLEAAVASGHMEGEPRRTMDALRGLVDESLARVRELEELFASYRQSTPQFIDEFLSPGGIITRKREIDESISASLAEIAGLRGNNDKLRVENRDLAARVEEYRKTLEELRVNRARLESRRTSLQENTRRVEREVAEQRQAIEAQARTIAQTRTTVAAVGVEIDAQKVQVDALAAEETRLKDLLSGLEKEIAELNHGLVTNEKDLKGRLAELARLQADVEKGTADVAEVNAEIRTIYENFKETHSRDLSEFESRMFDIKRPVADLRADLAALREKLRALGQVNLMAPEEFAEVEERYKFLQTQMDDLRKAREDLRRVTDEIRKESTQLFLSTYEMIKKNFHAMFRRLFGGGRAELRLVDPDKVLESGIDILAQPPGKKLESIDLLSGGERSLTATALLFATYLVKPSPFCILDEIDAALDEENIGRFTNLLAEFAGTTQFLIITHNKRTVVAATTLLGITMEESGVSKIIGLRLKEETPASSN